MRAVAFHTHAPALDVYQLLADYPDPVPERGEVLVRVSYAALNRLDNWVRLGWKGLDLVLPHIPCSDFSGTIAAVGPDAGPWQVGQCVTANPLIWCGECRACVRGVHNLCRSGRLIGEHLPGACAEYMVVPARNLVAIPDGYDMARAAAASLVYVTAWHSLMVAGQLRGGETVLVIGAGGGVNIASLQIARRAGAEVYVVAGSAEKAQQALAMGATWAHDRAADPDWSTAVYQATERQGVDMVVDNVGQATWSNSLRSLRPGGRLVTVGGTSGYNAQTAVNLIFGRQLRIIGSTMGTQDDYLTVMELVFAGRLQPVIDTIFRMEQFQAAMTRMLADEMFGKILIAVHPS